MIIQTGKLSGLGIVADRAQPSAGDNDVQAPALMLDALPVPLLYQQRDSPAAGTSTVAKAATSIHSGFTVSRAAGAASQTTRLFFLGQGLWKIEVNFWVNIPATAVTTMQLNALFGDPNAGLSTIPIFSFDGWTTTITSPGYYGTWLTIPRNNELRVELTLDNTGGTSIMKFAGSWDCARYA